MSKNPWFKCFPSDFLNGVAHLSPNELAVYTICIMRIYDEEGPIPHDHERIARRCNMRPTACRKALDALLDEGKLTLTPDGKLTNTRCEKSIRSRQEVSEKSAENARSRWGNRDEKPNEINDGSMPPHENCNAEAMLSRSQKPEARYQKETRERASDFLEWYGRYPNKVGRAAAEKAYLTARKKADHATLIAGLQAYIASKPADRAWCNPATWLNQERWADQPAGAEPRRMTPDDIRAGRVKSYHKTGFWDSSWGPQPEAA